MPYMELISFLGGAASGFVFKYLAQQAADRQQIVELLVKKQQAADESSDKAAARDQSPAGQWVRRFLVVSVMFGVILFPFILALFNQPTVVQEISPTRTFFGIFNWGGNVKFYELFGYFITPEVRTAVLAIIGFYFGNASAKR